MIAKLLRILIPLAIIAGVIYFNVRLVGDVKQGMQPAATPSETAVPVVTPAP